jgi:Zn-dependent peptidase ImmA (M78 family)
MFTLAHELAHIWAGRAAVFSLRDLQPAPDPTERFCNAAAAEFLVPEPELRAVWTGADVDLDQSLGRTFQFLARRFKVSELVAARRALDLRLITREAFSSFYNEYIEDERRRSSARRQFLRDAEFPDREIFCRGGGASGTRRPAALSRRF